MYYFFPGNYMWSQAVLRLLFTGGNVGEALVAVDALQDAARDYDYARWQAVWRDLGDQLWTRAEEQRAADHPRSARESYLRACAYYQWATTFMDHDDPERHRLHQRSLDAFGQFAALGEPPIERVEIPYEGSSFAAWYVPGLGAEARKPTIFYLPGGDSTKEQGICFAQAVAARGINVLLPDGPGVGESVLFRGMVNRYDYEVPGRADFDYLAARPDVDPTRIAVVGASLGGYRAPRVAAFEPRLAACVAWGALWDYSLVWEQRRKSEQGITPTRNAHMLFVMGARDFDEVTELFQAWKLEGVAHQIRCPMLITHGEDDAQTPVQQAYWLYEGAGSPTKELKIFTAAEGGSAHCQNDNRQLAHDYIADWLEDTLIRGRLRQGVIVGTERRA